MTPIDKEIQLWRETVRNSEQRLNLCISEVQRWQAKAWLAADLAVLNALIAARDIRK